MRKLPEWVKEIFPTSFGNIVSNEPVTEGTCGGTLRINWKSVMPLPCSHYYSEFRKLWRDLNCSL